MDGENGNTRPSGIRVPATRLPQFSSSIPGLHEITDSQSNARAQHSSMPPPVSLKRGLPTPVSQPDAKRKPLYERAGTEFPGRPGAAPAAGARNVRGNSLKDLNRPFSTSSSGLPASRQISNNSYTSNSSYASSLGSGSRPPSRSHTRTRSTTRPGRPASSTGTRADGQNSASTTGNNGTVPPSTVLFTKNSSSGAVRGRKVRKHMSVQDMRSTTTYEPLPAAREVSFCQKFDTLSMKGTKVDSHGNQAASQCDTPTQQSSLIPLNVSARKRGNDATRRSDMRIQEDRDGPAAPKTPSSKQILAKLEHSIKAAVTPAVAMSPSPTKAPFLSKSSNLTGCIVTDIDERVGRMDSELQRVREFMESTEKNNANVKDELDGAKKRAASLEDERNELRSEKIRLQDKLTDAERQARNLEWDLQEEKRRHERYCSELEIDHKKALDIKAEEFGREMDKVERLQQEFEDRCGAQAESRLENLSNENKELRHNLERAKRDHEHEIQLLQEDIHRRDADLRRVEDELRTAASDRLGLESQIRGNVETIDRLRKRAEDAEESLSKDKGHLGGQISLLSSTLDLKSERIQNLEEETKSLQAKCKKDVEAIKLAAQKEIAEATDALRQRLMKEEERRHKLFEQVQELKGNIRVMCRIKPPTDPAEDALIPFKPRVSDLDEDKIDGVAIPTERPDVRDPGKMIPGKPKEFNFERVFDDGCTNSDVFDEISQLVQSVMDGKKVCIFCYGQTGSGKTFTMSKRQGDGDDGIIPRTQDMIFSEIERLKALGWEYTVEGSYLEVYQDKLYDLLASRHSKPEPLMVDPIGEELNIKGHDFTLLNEERDLDDMVKTADNNRHTAATAKNDRSSRSHSILVLKITGTKTNEAGEVIKTRKGTMNLIDLAGSETPDNNGPPQVYKEGVEINSSLSYLRTVLSSLGHGKTEGVDFRSYTLTQLLRPSLGKGCRTLMFVMVSPLKENENETIRSLEFARDAQKVKMGGNGAGKAKK